MDINRDSPAVALIGGGWYKLETSARGEQFRWANNDAWINLAHLTTEPLLLRLDVEPGPAVGLKPFDLNVFKNGTEKIATARIPGRKKIEFILPGGEARVERLELRAETDIQPLPMENDKRVLKFRIFDIEAVPRPVEPPKPQASEQLSQLQSEISQLKSKLEAIERNLHEAHQEKERQAGAATAARHELQSANDQRAEIESRLGREIEARDAVIERLEASATRARRECDELKQMIEERDKTIQDLRGLAEERLEVIRTMHDGRQRAG